VSRVGQAKPQPQEAEVPSSLARVLRTPSVPWSEDRLLCSQRSGVGDGPGRCVTPCEKIKQKSTAHSGSSANGSPRRCAATGSRQSYRNEDVAHARRCTGETGYPVTRARARGRTHGGAPGQGTPSREHEGARMEVHRGGQGAPSREHAGARTEVHRGGRVIRHVSTRAHAWRWAAQTGACQSASSLDALRCSVTRTRAHARRWEKHEVTRFLTTNARRHPSREQRMEREFSRVRPSLAGRSRPSQATAHS
jgi:hypothetical protein